MPLLARKKNHLFELVLKIKNDRRPQLVVHIPAVAQCLEWQAVVGAGAHAIEGVMVEVFLLWLGRFVVVERVVERGASKRPSGRSGPSGGIQLSPRAGARPMTLGSSS